MKEVKQKLILHKLDGTDEFYEIKHLYADLDKHFEENNRNIGYHIQLGTDEEALKFEEVDGIVAHEIPENLPDIEVQEVEEDITDNDIMIDYGIINEEMEVE